MFLTSQLYRKRTNLIDERSHDFFSIPIRSVYIVIKGLRDELWKKKITKEARPQLDLPPHEENSLRLILGGLISKVHPDSTKKLFDKFKDCLQWKAFFLANQTASYSPAMEELNKTFEDSFKLAKAYLDEVRAGMSIQKLQKAAKNVMYQVNQIPEDALEI
ncbi:unnamed protein product [Lepeophtheirus salmonis]|uniref:(salmon louse) hypothetical protein n=1 Tax=Lepeophtheirus salmonis TaxID=72036 RepID=A0A7R8CW49_LEPSM|nr:unnamed protein product [Lepeophtheirus salmonis]CAF2948896.1 unnamed protein product [Lepeophtheirus salmonis]